MMIDYVSNTIAIRIWEEWQKCFYQDKEFLSNYRWQMCKFVKI